MKNSERFTTAKERAEAFKRFCDNECGACPLFGKPCYTENCQFYWLDLEAQSEEMLPCPFCGGECYVEGGENFYGEYWIQCADSHCDYSSASKGNSDAAIAAHNRVARAAAKGKEATA